MHLIIKCAISFFFNVIGFECNFIIYNFLYLLCFKKIFKNSLKVLNEAIRLYILCYYLLWNFLSSQEPFHKCILLYINTEIKWISLICYFLRIAFHVKWLPVLLSFLTHHKTLYLLLLSGILKYIRRISSHKFLPS